MATTEGQAGHWDAAYGRRGAEAVSWHQEAATVSLELLDVLGVGPDASVVDAGGGASSLAGQLVARAFRDVVVVDVSTVALEEARRRAGEGSTVSWRREDLLAWRPERAFDVWHDRAVFHFLTTPERRDRYLRTLHAALRPGGSIVLGTFAADGPERCSGLPVARYSAAELAAALGPAFDLVEARREAHVTPAGATQPFTWVAGRMHAET